MSPTPQFAPYSRNIKKVNNTRRPDQSKRNISYHLQWHSIPFILKQVLSNFFKDSASKVPIICWKINSLKGLNHSTSFDSSLICVDPNMKFLCGFSDIKLLYVFYILCFHLLKALQLMYVTCLTFKLNFVRLLYEDIRLLIRLKIYLWACFIL